MIASDPAFIFVISSPQSDACLLDDSRESRRQLPRVAYVPQLAPPPMATPPGTAILPVPPVHDSNAADEPKERKKGRGVPSKAASTVAANIV